MGGGWYGEEGSGERREQVVREGRPRCTSGVALRVTEGGAAVCLRKVVTVVSIRKVVRRYHFGSRFWKGGAKILRYS
jgi:hypothetical protein